MWVGDGVYVAVVAVPHGVGRVVVVVGVRRGRVGAARAQTCCFSVVVGGVRVGVAGQVGRTGAAAVVVAVPLLRAQRVVAGQDWGVICKSPTELG